MQAIEAQTAAPASTCFAQRYAASDESCPQARRDVAKVLSDLGLSDDGTFAASIFVTDLFTNAIVHHTANGEEHVHVAIHESHEGGQRWTGIAVTDTGSGAVRPAADAALCDSESGRGLEVMRGMGARLTDVRLPGGYTVMAWTPVSDELRRRVCQCDCSGAHGREPSACSWLIEARDGWDEDVRNDDPDAHLCSACRRLKPLPDTHRTAAEPAGAAAAKTGSFVMTDLTVTGR